MERQIKQLTEEEYKGFATLANEAFPGLHADKWLEDHIKQTPHEALHGVYKDGKLIAGMRTFDFAMNLDGTEVAAGGVGMIAVDLLHKKERNAYHLMQHFFKINQENGSNVAMLHPFKTSFYKKMGFGIGTRVYQFHWTQLHSKTSRKRII